MSILRLSSTSCIAYGHGLWLRTHELAFPKELKHQSTGARNRRIRAGPENRNGNVDCWEVSNGFSNNYGRLNLGIVVRFVHTCVRCEDDGHRPLRLRSDSVGDDPNRRLHVSLKLVAENIKDQSGPRSTCEPCRPICETPSSTGSQTPRAPARLQRSLRAFGPEQLKL